MNSLMVVPDEGISTLMEKGLLSLGVDIFCLRMPASLGQSPTEGPMLDAV